MVLCEVLTVHVKKQAIVSILQDRIVSMRNFLDGFVDFLNVL